MSKRPKQQSEAFADVVARARSTPRQRRRVPPGRHGEFWGDRSGRAFTPVTETLSPAAAQALAAAGAQVVYDECGCGGTECELDWLTQSDIAQLAASSPPVLRPSHDGRADLEHWRSNDGHDLIVAAVQIEWGSRITG